MTRGTWEKQESPTSRDAFFFAVSPLGTSQAPLIRLGDGSLLPIGDFSGFRAGRRGRHFRPLFHISDPKGARDLCKGWAGSEEKVAER